MKRSANGLLLITSLFIAIWLGELILRAAAVNASYSERNQQIISRIFTPSYLSIFNNSEPLWEPNTTSEDSRKEFDSSIKINNAGFVDRNWQVKRNKKRRVICLGDSFTQGVGAPTDSSYPRILETLYADSVEVMNAGIAGSDPFYEYIKLKRDLLKYKPDVAVFAFNSSDIFDVVMRLGEERFSENYDRLRLKAPWWEPIYAQSYFFRLFIHQGLGYSYSFMDKTELEMKEAKALNDLEHCLDMCSELCSINNIQCIFVFQPMRGEVFEKMQLEPAIRYAANKGYRYLDMRNVYLANKIDSFQSYEYFWPIDGHNKPKGYALMAVALKNQILRDSLLTR